ncbi:hypothetical protein SERLA73DRAFT_47941, partial [Serpula lacrymans var. lacrymans S7.3]
SDSRFFIDDCLSQNELDLISVIYNVYTGNGPQTLQSSLWPKNSTFMGEGLNHGFWSSSAEKWFCARLDHITNNTADLRAVKTWTNSMVMNRRSTKVFECSDKLAHGVVLLWF